MRRSSNRPFRIVTHWLPVIALCMAIYRQSSFPGIITDSLFPHADKAIHFMVYLALAWLTARLLAAETKTLTIPVIRLTAIIFSSLFGLSDEIHQAFVPSRDASLADFAADVIGSITGSSIYFHIIADKAE